jgi:uncharacterized protein (TIGR03085 family)
VGYARDERLALCALLEQTGPSAPTLCEGWRTADLAAHLVLRERRPDAAAGVLGGPLAPYTRRVHHALLERYSFAQLIELIRGGPPWFSPLAIPGADERANVVEFFVHHEDIWRAQPGWQPRDLPPGLSEVLWDRLRGARFLLRRAPVGVELIRAGEPAPDGPAASRHRLTVKAATPVVSVTGTPAELTMWAFGRTTAAQVSMEGSEPDVRALSGGGWRH